MKASNFILCAVLLFAAGCATVVDPVTGKKTHPLTPQSKAEIAQAAAIAEEAVIAALIGGATSAASQYLATGTVNEKQLASASIYGATATMQGSVGQAISQDLIAASTGTPAIGAAIAPIIAATPAVTQKAIDSLNDVAAKLVHEPETANP